MNSCAAGPLLMGISTKGKSPVGSPRCSPHDGSLLSPGGTTTGRSLLDQPSAPVEAASHDLTVVRLLSVPGIRQGELVGQTPLASRCWRCDRQSAASVGNA